MEWNTFSITSIQEYCRKMGFQSEFLPFELETNTLKHKEQPLRSWTLELVNGKKMIINGLQLIHNFYLLRMWK